MDRDVPPRPPARLATGLVAAGGAAGASARWAIEEAFDLDGFPWTLVVVNVVGCLVVGGVAVWPTSTGWGEAARLGLGVGVAGGLTTFSGFALAAVRLHDEGRTSAAVGFVAVSMLAGLVAVGIGSASARRVSR